jgi:hypothetical protein
MMVAGGQALRVAAVASAVLFPLSPTRWLRVLLLLLLKCCPGSSSCWCILRAPGRVRKPGGTGYIYG